MAFLFPLSRGGKNTHGFFYSLSAPAHRVFIDNPATVVTREEGGKLTATQSNWRNKL
jgi:hypothetical protein